MEKIRAGESQKREDTGARKGREVAKHSVFPVFCGSGGSKSRLAKAVGAEASGQMRHEKLHAVVARSKFRSQTCKNLTVSECIRSLLEVDVEKVHIVAARKASPSQTAQNTI